MAVFVSLACVPWKEGFVVMPCIFTHDFLSSNVSIRTDLNNFEMVLNIFGSITFEKNISICYILEFKSLKVVAILLLVNFPCHSISIMLCPCCFLHLYFCFVIIVTEAIKVNDGSRPKFSIRSL